MAKWYEKIGATGADIFTAGGYSAAKEKLMGGNSSSYLAPINPVVAHERAKRKAAGIREDAVGDARSRQGQMHDEMQTQRAQDLDRMMGLYGPAMGVLEQYYGIPMSAWGEALPQNRQAPPSRTGTMPGGQPFSVDPRAKQFMGQLGELTKPGPKPIPGLKPVPGMTQNMDQFYKRSF